MLKSVYPRGGVYIKHRSTPPQNTSKVNLLSVREVIKETEGYVLENIPVPVEPNTDYYFTFSFTADTSTRWAWAIKNSSGTSLFSGNNAYDLSSSGTLFQVFNSGQNDTILIAIYLDKVNSQAVTTRFYNMGIFAQ